MSYESVIYFLEFATVGLKYFSVCGVFSGWSGLSALNLICVLGAAASDAGSLGLSRTPARWEGCGLVDRNGQEWTRLDWNGLDNGHWLCGVVCRCCIVVGDLRIFAGACLPIGRLLSMTGQIRKN